MAGPGGIAARFGDAMADVEGGHIAAVASTSEQRAHSYADRYDVATVHHGYERLAEDGDVDIVYVATPHAFHVDHAVRFLEAGKHVLCEKPMALDADQVETTIAAARANGVFLMEAMWSRFLPAQRRLLELVDSGRIGQVLRVEADFGFRMPVMADHRLFDPALGGGALLDLGVYPIDLCRQLLGPIDRVVADGRVGQTGVDEQVTAVLRHAGGGLGIASAAITVGTSCTARVSGSDGWIDIPAFMHCPDHLAVNTADGSERIDCSFDGDGLRFEIDAVHDALDAGLSECPDMPHEASLAMARVTDDIRSQLGVEYPSDHRDRSPAPAERVFYSSSVHDDDEIDAVVEVLRSGPQGLWPGRRVVAMERRVSKRFGKAYGTMVNSGSSALYLATELLDAAPGDEIVTCGLTFSTDIAPIIRRGLVPVLVDCELDTFCVDVDRIEEAITPRTRAMLFPNLIGNAPDWDAIAAIAAKHGLVTIEDSCDALGPVLRGRPTGERSTMSVTSFANSHIITCGGNGGMIMFDDEKLRDRSVMLRRWGRRSELHFFGSKRKDRDFWEDLDGIEYDNQFIFDELAWNFEPSEMGAAFGLQQLAKLEDNLGRRRALFDAYTEFFGAHRDRIAPPRQTEDLETAWLGYPLLIRPDAGFGRPDLQEFLDGRGIDTRTIWTGNVARQPMVRGSEIVVPDDGLPNADEVMTRGVLLPLSHAIDESTASFVFATLEEFLARPVLR